MTAYLIADVQEVTDADKMAEYGPLASKTVADHGGRLIGAGPGETIEGDWSVNHMVVIEFPYMATLKRWYDSPEYQEAAAMRQAAARVNIVFVDGA